jgi:hypothetical protein
MAHVQMTSFRVANVRGLVFTFKNKLLQYGRVWQLTVKRCPICHSGIKSKFLGQIYCKNVSFMGPNKVHVGDPDPDYI